MEFNGMERREMSGGSLEHIVGRLFTIHAEFRLLTFEYLIHMEREKT